jgi:hypothetical protein
MEVEKETERRRRRMVEKIKSSIGTRKSVTINAYAYISISIKISLNDSNEPLRYLKYEVRPNEHHGLPKDDCDGLCRPMANAVTSSVQSGQAR